MEDIQPRLCSHKTGAHTYQPTPYFSLTLPFVSEELLNLAVVLGL